MKKDITNEMGKKVKNIVTQLIKNISVIAIFLILILVILTSLGAEFSLKGFLQSGFGVSSVLLAIGNILLYELWLRNGQNNGREETQYKDCLDEFQKKSKNISAERMQMFIEFEKQRRYEVEEKKLVKEIEHINKLLGKKTLSEKARKRLEKKKQILEDHVIIVDMPYKVSEELDGLRYAMRDSRKKEYKPSDFKKYLRAQRSLKYLMTSFFTTFSINLIVMGSINGHWWEALLSFLIAIVCIIISVVTGFSNGYHSIAVTSFGVYQTANDFIDKAISWCTKEGFSLYYADDEEEVIYKKTIESIPFTIDEPEDYYRPTLMEVFGMPEVIIE